MSHFLRLTTFALIWRKLDQGWQFLQEHRRQNQQFQQLEFYWPVRLEELWLKLLPPRCYHYFIINMLVGLGIVSLIFLFQNKPFLAGIEDDGMDKLMFLYQKRIPALENKNIPPFVFLDIDDKTYESWGAPLFTPRNHLLNLIDIAVRAEARLVIVDIDLSREMPLEGLGHSPSRHPYDQALSHYIENYAAACSCRKNISQKTCPPIILVRAFQSMSPTSTQIIRPSFLDEAVEQSTPYVQWASTAFHRNYYDRMVRHWWLWQSACTAQRQPTVIPSIQLLAATLIRNGISQHKAFEKTLQSFQPQNCKATSTKKTLPPQIQIGDLTLSTGFFGIEQRVMFSLPWITQEKSPKVALHDQAQQVAMRIVSAQHYDKPLFAQQLTGSIVVIGGSYQEGHDIHWTPLEEMPGALIIINAIHTLLEYGELQPLPMTIKILTYFVLVVLMSFILARFGYSRGTFILAVFVIPLLILFSILLFRSGIWLDFMLPLAVVMHLLPL